MRPVQALGKPGFNAPVNDKINWCMEMLTQICDASQIDASAIADPYTVANLTPSRTIDASTATLPQVREVLGTLLSDMKKRGMNRGVG